MTTTAEALHLQRFLEFFGNVGEAPVENRFDSSHVASSGGKDADLSSTLRARLLWLQAKHEERKLPVIKEPTQTNTADGFTKALQTAKCLEWRNRSQYGIRQH